MNKRVRSVLAISMFILIIVLPLASLFWVSEQLHIATPPLLICTIFVASFLVSLEVANRIGPKPFTTLFAKLSQRYPNKRDQFVVIGAVMIGWSITFYRLPYPADNLLTAMIIGILGFIVGVVLCILLGSTALRGDIKSYISRHLLKR